MNIQSNRISYQEGCAKVPNNNYSLKYETEGFHMSAVQIFSSIIICLFWVPRLYAAGYQAPADIVAALPKFCWAQYIASAEDNPDFQISGCGAAANHYCPGLVQMAQAEREKNLNQKYGKLAGAKGNMEYTLNNTKNYPECILRPLAQNNLQRINFDLEMLRSHQRSIRR